MLTPDQYPETLRTLGQWLDTAQADDAEIDLESNLLSLRWQALDGTWDLRPFTTGELTRMSEGARHQRTHELGQPAGEWTVCLRALGQELASESVEISSIRLDGAGFQVSGRRQRLYFNEWYSLEGLLERNMARRTERVLDALRSPLSVKGAGWRRLLGLTAG
jgi:hypothetical protein